MRLLYEVDKILNTGTREIHIPENQALDVTEEEIKEIVRLCKLNGVYIFIEGVGKWDFRR